MRQFFLSFLITITAIVSFTFSGVLLLNHENNMMAPMDAVCISQCIQNSTINGIVPVSTGTQMVLLFFAVILFFRVIDTTQASRVFRNDDDVGKILLRKKLATIRIQD